MLRNLLFLLLLVLVAGNSLEQRVSLLEQALVDAVETANDLQSIIAWQDTVVEGLVVFYLGRTSCPKGWSVATQLNGRYMLVENTSPGAKTDHTVYSTKPQLQKPCEQIISVADSGLVDGTCSELMF